MAKKSKTIKFTKTEMEALNNLKGAYSFIESSLGNLEIQRLTTEQALESIETKKIRLETQYVQEQANESKLLSQLNEKYGAGNLDINTGEFTPYK
tara:strand:- start:302 stop:586 length:285 start_codon:yes stop_codon:yes gene_type:complete